jgi:GNAT superfamily N-acetyltransferase
VLILRPARWPDDLALLAGLDASFTTELIYRVIRDEYGFQLVEERVDPPLHKGYGSILDDDCFEEMAYAAVAEHEGELVGFAAAEYEAWNRRMAVRHLYVASHRRRSGIGTAFLNEMDTAARSAGARCLWLDTSNVNYPAIQFYQRAGFRLCGLDESFYGLEEPARDEVALFFVRELNSCEAHTSTPATGRP